MYSSQVSCYFLTFRFFLGVVSKHKQRLYMFYIVSFDRMETCCERMMIDSVFLKGMKMGDGEHTI